MGYFFLTSEQKIRRNNIIMGNKHLMKYLRCWIILFDGTYCIAVGIQGEYTINSVHMTLYPV